MTSFWNFHFKHCELHGNIEITWPSESNNGFIIIAENSPCTFNVILKLPALKVGGLFSHFSADKCCVFKWGKTVVCRSSRNYLTYIFLAGSDACLPRRKVTSAFCSYLEDLKVFGFARYLYKEQKWHPFDWWLNKPTLLEDEQINYKR